MSKRSWIGAGLLVGAVVLTLIAPNTYYLFTIGMMAITVLVAVGLNILVGLSGQVSIGHAGFFAMGAYTGSLLMLNSGWSFWPAAGAATVAAAGTGAALAAPALRVTGPYLAMVTIAFGVIVERVLIEWVGLTGGFGGLMNIPKPGLLGLQPALRDVVLISVLLAFLGVLSFAWLKQHAWGKALLATQDDEIAATTLGLNTLYVKVVAFGLSAAFTGLAGLFFAATVGFISPDSFTFHRSILFLLAIILGGLGIAEGALVGGVVLVLIPELLHDLAEYQLLVFGLLLLLTLWLAPRGVMSLFRRWFNRQEPVYPLATPPELPALISRNLSADVLRVQQVGIQFGGVHAVEGVSLEAHPGTVTAVIGPNGAGKTTLLNLISGFYRSQSGSIRLGSLDLTSLSGLQIANAGIRRTFQATRLFNNLSVLDNLRVAYRGGHLGNPLAALVGIGRSRQPEKILLEMLAFVGYHGDVHQQAINLPFVDRRLVEIARALVTGPQVLLLDEPAAGLGREDKQTLAQLIRRVASTGLKVIVIEHDMELVMGISDQVLVLDSGQLIAAGKPQEVQRNPAVLAAYLGVETPDIQRSSIPNDFAPMLKLHKLRAGYGQLQVLHAVSLEVNAGELVAVIGANGAGKSTLLKALAQLIRADGGEIQFQGRSLFGVAAHEVVHEGIALVPEGRQVFAELSVQDNIRLGAYHRQDAQIEADLEAALRRFPALLERRHQKAGLLSGGEQQMLAIARGLMARPQLLLLDEPSLGLAPKLVVELYGILAKLRDEGMTILLVDQMASLALAVCDRAYLLEMGKIVGSGTAAELRQDREVARIYLGASESS